MSLNLQQSKLTYLLDFVIYGIIITIVSVAFFFIPNYSPTTLFLISLGGFFLWQILEYFIHRYFFHHIRPFKDWHDEHHNAPTALIATPTWLSILVLISLGSLPSWLLFNWQISLAFSNGVFLGYLIYGLMHYWMHNPNISWRWLRGLRRKHALHHHFDDKNFGVTSPLFDIIFGTLKK